MNWITEKIQVLKDKTVNRQRDWKGNHSYEAKKKVADRDNDLPDRRRLFACIPREIV